MPEVPAHDMDDDAIARIEAALIALLRRTNDPRGNQRINDRAGVDIERSGSVMLARIEEFEPVRLCDLADMGGIDTSTASRQVARLVDAGYVERRPDPDDGRATGHYLTESGQRIRGKLKRARREWFEEVVAEFSPDERDQFADLLVRFVDRMDAIREAQDAVGV
ncbi:MAG: MarR family transcriptional regulator [Acidimicrobiales bacterium]|nr:MarR family transcriptional regulator [Acidimicrobiales bacterium]